MSSPAFHLSNLAYTKLIFHALKYPHQTVNGVLIGSLSPSGTVEIVDAVPLQHHWTNLSPTMQIGLGMAMNHASSHQLRVVGYYQAPERVGDTALSPVGERVASKIKETFPTPVALVINGSRLNDESGSALVPYVASANTFHQLTVEGRFRFDRTIPARALRLARQSRLLNDFGDFDDYLENRSVQFLSNGVVQAALNSPPPPRR
ncbi:hypothetical protein BGW80DRAFT_1204411 [Lactifluus volemus]|nr:hypothetical protein BGW80DRAFT_1204411 [Lactifluus volemus]